MVGKRATVTYGIIRCQKLWAKSCQIERYRTVLRRLGKRASVAYGTMRCSRALNKKLTKLLAVRDAELFCPAKSFDPWFTIVEETNEEYIKAVNVSKREMKGGSTGETTNMYRYMNDTSVMKLTDGRLIDFEEYEASGSAGTFSFLVP